MKYIILASLLSSAALAAPFAQQSTNANAGANTQAGAGTQAGQTQAGQQQAGQAQAGQQAGQTQAGQQTGQTGQAGQAQAGQNVPTAGTGAQGTPSQADLATAVANWMADTSMVSAFLDQGPTITNNAAFKQAATVAFNAEVDELNHKAIIEGALASDPNVQAANSTLAGGGAFQDVVDKLQIMSQQGLAASNNIDLILQNRCTNVLPNIDAYMAATGSSSQAVRPQACDQTGVTNGVQSLGPTQPGGTPGTPQQAFDAAAALANGTGNGITPTQQGGAAQQAGQQQAGQAQAGAAGTGTAATGTAQAGQAQAGQQAQGTAQAGQGQQAQGQQAQGQQAQGTAQAGQGQQAQGQQAQGQQAQGQQAQGTAQAGQQAQGQAGQAQAGQQAGAAQTQAQGQASQAAN